MTKSPVEYWFIFRHAKVSIYKSNGLIKMSGIKNGEGFNQRMAECAGILNLVKVAKEGLQGRNCEWSLSYEILVKTQKYQLKWEESQDENICFFPRYYLWWEMTGLQCFKFFQAGLIKILR